MSVLRPANHAPPWTWAIFALLLIAFAALTLAASPRKSASFDEQYHLSAGYTYARTGDFRLATTHPPLVGLLASLPLLGDEAINLPVDDPTWEVGDRYAFSDIFLWYAENDAPRLLQHGRWAVIALGLCTVAVVFLWGRRLFGVWGALLAVWLAALDPNLLANARVITTDMGVTLFLLLALWRLWAWLEGDSAANLLWAGLAAGAAMGAKYNGLLLWPIVVAVLLIHPLPVKNARREIGARMGALMAMGAAALGFLWLLYGFDFGAVTLGSITVPLPAPFYWANLWATLSGLLEQSSVKPNFLLGQAGTGWWYYFPVAIVYKTPLPLLLLAAGGVVAGVRGGVTRRQVALWAAPLAFLSLALTGVLTIGYRHLLPALPFLCLLAGNNEHWFAARAGRNGRIAQGLVSVAALWLLVSTLWFFPNHDGYFNELAGRWTNWSNLLVDSNLDWGQDLPALRDELAARNIERVNLAYFGKAAPEAYGVNYAPLPGYLRFMNGREPAAYNPVAPEPGWYAISATSLRLGTLDAAGVDLYAWFRNRPPDGRAGYSIYLYNVVDAPGAVVTDAVLTGEPVFSRPPAELGGPTARTQARWRQGEQIEVLPGGNNLTVPVEWGYAGSGYDSGVFKLLGYTINPTAPKPGNTLRIKLVWQRGEAPMPMPSPIRGEAISAFVQLATRTSGTVMAGYDGWDVALRGLLPGDVLVQHVEIDLPENLPVGMYSLFAGLYSPQDGQRLQFSLDAEIPLGPTDMIPLGDLDVQG
jgi:4-amino-4-deoxy-L-arabinose transferase-like glycosyltransferase